MHLQLINNNNQMLILYNIEPDDCMFKDELVKAVHSAETVVVFTPFMNDVFSEHADIIIPIKTPYEICGSFINVSGVLQSFNLDLVQQNSIQYNQDILFDTLDYAEAEPLPFDNIISKTQLFIAETKANINPNTELPSIKSSADHLGSSYNFNLYNIDSIVRRSEPLQLTKESKIETES